MRTAQQATDEWAARMSAAQEKIRAGVEAVTESPTQKAAANLSKYLQRTAEAVNSGKMARKLNAVSLQTWKSSFLEKISRVGSGAQAAKPKMLKHLQAFLPYVQQVRQQVRAMPSTTYEERKARMLANADALHQFGAGNRG